MMDDNGTDDEAELDARAAVEVVRRSRHSAEHAASLPVTGALRSSRSVPVVRSGAVVVEDASAAAMHADVLAVRDDEVQQLHAQLAAAQRVADGATARVARSRGELEKVRSQVVGLRTEQDNLARAAAVHVLAGWMAGRRPSLLVSAWGRWRAAAARQSARQHRGAATEATRELAASRRRCADLEALVQDLQRRVAAAQQLATEASARVSGVDADAHAALQRRAADAELAVQQLQRELATSGSDAAAARAEVAALGERVAAADAHCIGLADQLTDACLRLRDAEKRAVDAEGALQRVTAAATRSEQHLSDAFEQAATATARVRSLGQRGAATALATWMMGRQRRSVLRALGRWRDAAAALRARDLRRRAAAATDDAAAARRAATDAAADAAACKERLATVTQRADSGEATAQSELSRVSALLRHAEDRADRAERSAAERERGVRTAEQQLAALQEEVAALAARAAAAESHCVTLADQLSESTLRLRECERRAADADASAKTSAAVVSRSDSKAASLFREASTLRSALRSNTQRAAVQAMSAWLAGRRKVSVASAWSKWQRCVWRMRVDTVKRREAALRDTVRVRHSHLPVLTLLMSVLTCGCGFDDAAAPSVRCRCRRCRQSWRWRESTTLPQP
jgi:chromosome segregation ATPase